MEQLFGTPLLGVGHVVFLKRRAADGTARKQSSEAEATEAAAAPTGPDRQRRFKPRSLRVFPQKRRMTALSSWELCVKYALFIFNFIFWLAGTGVLAVGLWLRFDSRTKPLFEADGSPSVFFTGVYILIVAGALMMVVGFLGCCGAIKESTCMLGLFFVFLLIIFTVEVAAGIWGLSNKDRVVEDLTQFYKETYTNYQSTKQDALKEALRGIHFGLNCCGPTGTVFDGGNEICPKKEGLDVLVTTSCPAAIDDAFNNKLHIIGGVGIGIGIVTIFGMIFSMILCCGIRKSRNIM